jgi:hypothetical protein
MGDASLLIQKHELWRKIIDILKNQQAFGNYLTLRCQCHTDKFTQVAVESDFKNVEDGGCNKLCGQTLSCGHSCPRFCHPYSMN